VNEDGLVGTDAGLATMGKHFCGVGGVWLGQMSGQSALQG